MQPSLVVWVFLLSNSIACELKLSLSLFVCALTLEYYLPDGSDEKRLGLRWLGSGMTFKAQLSSSDAVDGLYSTQESSVLGNSAVKGERRLLLQHVPFLSAKNRN